MLPETNRSRALAAGAVLVAVAMVVVLVRACGSGGPDLDPLPDGEKRPEPLSFSGKPMWDERKLGMVRVAGAELRGDAAAVVAGDVGGIGGARLAAADVRTGAPRWVVDAGSPLKGGDGAQAHQGHGSRAEQLSGVTGKPLLYGDGDDDSGDWTVLVQYSEGSRGDETEIGVAALSGKDGAVRWKHALIRPESGDKGDDDRGQKVRLLAADTRVVLASVEGEEATELRTVALDPATGGELWRNEDGWAYRFAGGLVLGETRGDRPPPARWDAARKNSDVFALDVRTGAKRWDLNGTFESSDLDAVAGGTAAVTVRERKPGRTYEDRRTALLDAATGRETARDGETGSDGVATENDRLWDCADDGRTLIACSGADGRLVTVRPGAGEDPFITKKPPFDEDSMAQVGLVWRDRVFVHASSGGDRPLRRAAVDRAGNRIGAAPRGEVAAVSEKAVAFRVDRKGSSTDGGLAVHAAAFGAEPPEASASARPVLKPPGIDATPLWTAVTSAAAASGTVPGSAGDMGLTTVEDVRLAGGALVLTGRDAEDDDRDEQVVVDVENGKVRWSVRDGASLGGGAEATFVGVSPVTGLGGPRIVDMGGEWLSFVEYRGPGGVEGVAALSLKDGSVRWKKQVTSGNGYAALEAADRETFAVRVSERGAGDETVVYATGSRKDLWRKRGVTPESTGGGLVLAAEPGPQGRARRDLIAYGASDGGLQWRLGDRYRDPRLLHDAGGETVVIGTADGGAVLDRATGRELARTYVPLDRCDGDGDTLIVCEANPDAPGGSASARAVTIQTRDGATKIQDLLETGFLTRYAAFGNWFAAHRPATIGPGAQAGRFLVFDGDGRLLSDDLPGMPQAIGGGFAVLSSSEIMHGFGGGVATFTVHRVRE
ncbi:hypothetical protein E1281_10335 [Actinomadura sp. KC345]|uniref:PQQ-binding-like beta-propeller repeat protein n=1 Tax=Actinomadura sp. KC345 TaxID=2530371 RepID=UPI00104BA252|nr:PQQ-binding-like beta-propeller repeat protein [Actinomadura sp. KC345]TDC55845.1 hypothetical protein E1281_10335 [Actinomadura sp. KC345]